MNSHYNVSYKSIIHQPLNRLLCEQTKRCTFMKTKYSFVTRILLIIFCICFIVPFTIADPTDDTTFGYEIGGGFMLLEVVPIGSCGVHLSSNKSDVVPEAFRVNMLIYAEKYLTDTFQ